MCSYLLLILKTNPFFEIIFTRLGQIPACFYWYYEIYKVAAFRLNFRLIMWIKYYYLWTFWNPKLCRIINKLDIIYDGELNEHALEFQRNPHHDKWSLTACATLHVFWLTWLTSSTPYLHSTIIGIYIEGTFISEDSIWPVSVHIPLVYHPSPCHSSGSNSRAVEWRLVHTAFP